MTPLQRLLAALKLDTAQRRRDAVLAVLLTVIFGGAVVASFEVGDDDGDGRPDRGTVTIRVDGKDADRKADDPLPVTPPAQAVAVDAGGEVGPAHGDNERDETPPGSPVAAPGNELKTSPNPEARDAFRDSQAAAKRTTTGPDTPLGKAPLAAQSTPGCRTAFVRNQSSRNGARPAVIFLHYTAGPNVRGLADLIGLTAYSNNPRAQVSWHYGIDREGNCFYNVPLDRKAWTEASANPFGIGIEGVGTGREPDYLGARGLAKLRTVVRYSAKLYGIPLRKAIVRNCRVAQSGIGTHQALGACGGGHVDITNRYSLDAVIRYIAAPAAPSARAQARANSLCSELNRYRHGPAPRPSRERAHKVRAHLIAERWSCNGALAVHK